MTIEQIIDLYTSGRYKDETQLENDIRAILENPSERHSVNNVDLKENNVLHYAAKHGHTNIVKLLLGYEYEYGNNDVVKMVLLFTGEGAKNILNFTPLHMAAMHDKHAVVEALIEVGADPKTRNTMACTPMHLAAQTGSVKAVRSLMRKRVNVELRDKRLNKLRDNPTKRLQLERLQNQKLKDHQRRKQELARGDQENRGTEDQQEQDEPVEQPQDVEIALLTNLVGDKDILKNTPLHLAVQKGHLDIVKELLNEKNYRQVNINQKMEEIIEINETSRDDETAMHIAANLGYIEIVDFLIKKGASRTLKTKLGGFEPMLLAAKNGHRRVIELLADKADKKMPDYYLIKNSADETILHLAASAGHLHLTEMLLSDQDSFKEHLLNSKDDAGNTPLHLAAANGKMEFVKWFLQQDGVASTAQNNAGENAFHRAAANNHTQVVRFLLEKDRQFLDTNDNKGNSAAHLAAQNGNREVFEYLMKEYWNSSQQNENKENVLHLACRNGHLNIVQYLIDQATAESLTQAVEMTDKFGKTPLFTAAESCKKEVMKLLLNQRVSCSTKNSQNNDNILHAAAKNGDLGVAETLADFVNNLSEMLQTKELDTYDTPLHVAVKNNNPRVVEWLLKKGADCRALNKNRDNPLQLAVDKHQVFVCLQQHSFADFSQEEQIRRFVSLCETPDKQGKRLVQLAEEKGNKQVCEDLSKLFSQCKPTETETRR